MNIDIAHIAATIVTLLAPFTPYLLDVSKAVGQKWAETLAEKGGEAAWNEARVIWEKIHTRFGDNAQVKGAALMVSTDPDDIDAQTYFAKALGMHLQEDPELAEDLLHLLGGAQAVQEILADRSSWVENVVQELEGRGTQTIRASEDSVIKGVRQTRKDVH